MATSLHPRVRFFVSINYSLYEMVGVFGHLKTLLTVVTLVLSNLVSTNCHRFGFPPGGHLGRPVEQQEADTGVLWPLFPSFCLCSRDTGTEGGHIGMSLPSEAAWLPLFPASG